MTILLELDLTGALVEDVGSHPVEKMMNRRRLALRTVVGRLAAAGEDPDVVGLLAKLGSTSITLAQAQELADAVAAFRAQGQSRPSPGPRPSARWAGGPPPMSSGPGSASCGCSPRAASGSWVRQPQARFVRGALDRANVEPLFSQRYEYKNAADTFMRSEFTEAHREATERLVESAYEQIVSAVARGRNLPEDRVRELIDRAPARRLGGDTRPASSIISATATRSEPLSTAAIPTSRRCCSSRAITGASTASAGRARHASPPWVSSRPSARSAPAGRNRARSAAPRDPTPWLPPSARRCTTSA